MAPPDADRVLDRMTWLAGRGEDLVTMWTHLTEVLAEAIPFYWTPCYYTLDPASHMITSHYHDGLAAFPEEWLRMEYDGQDVHSLIDVVRSPSGVSTLHEVTGGDPRATRRWQANIQMGGDQELIGRLRSRTGETWGAVGLYREPDQPMFSQADKDLLRRASPVLADGVRRALLLGEATDPEWPDAPGLLILDDHLAPESSSPGAERWLRELADATGWALPPAVRAVAAAALAGVEEEAVARVRTRSGGWAVAHGTPLRVGGHARVAVIIEPAEASRIVPLLMSAHGLTERERDVAGLVLKGLASKQIASRLVVSTSTVQQHMKRIFEKVGVNSRGELSARLFFTHYEPRLRDNEDRTAAQAPLRGGPAVPGGPATPARPAVPG